MMGLPESQNEKDARVEALWKKINVENKDRIGLDALRNGLRHIDHPMKDANELLEAVVKKMGRNGEGSISFEDFRRSVEKAEGQAHALFQSIDKDKDGRLDRKEMQSACEKDGVEISRFKLDKFFAYVDSNQDGFITWDEWRKFMQFVPIEAEDARPLKAIMTYYSSAFSLNAEGDATIRDDTLEGLGYFAAGGIAGAISRTATAPLDRLKVYLIANIDSSKLSSKTSEHNAMKVMKQDGAKVVAKQIGRPLIRALKELWSAGGIRSLFAGNGLNVVKVIPESAIRFGSYEAAKRALARFEGHDDPRNINPWSQFIAGGVGGIVSQFFVYPLDTLKFRMQCETVKGGLHGNALIAATARKMYQHGGIRSAYRGLAMGIVGMFPYSALDLATFEFLKKAYVLHKSTVLGCHPDEATPGSFATGCIGAISGAFGASAVYPLNVLRTRLQAQGTVLHPPTYTGIVDVTRKTLQNEGVPALFKGLTPNLLKVVPAVSITYVVYENSKKLMHLH